MSTGSLDARLTRRLLRGLGDPPIEFELRWTGERVAADGDAHVGRDDSAAQVSIADRGTLLGLLRDPQLRFGDAYSDGRIDVAGDLVKFMELVYRRTRDPLANRDRQGARTPLSRIADRLQRRGNHAPAASREHVHHHYDLGNDFYALWLGETMAYTCAYYAREEFDLDQAQTAKMDHICRKLWLGPQDSVVEAGCGWGSLALHMAARHGVKVRAFNVSREQIDWARHRARRLGLERRVEFVDDDYRNVHGRYDVVVSVGMLEHVGTENYPALGRLLRAALTPHGRGLVHTIGRNHPAPLQPWIEKRIFPGAYPPSLSEAAAIFEPARLTVLDVENLRLHYARTLRHWLERYEAAGAAVRALGFDEAFVRRWRLYLSGSLAAFETGELQLYQFLFAAEENNRIPLTREYLYPH